MANNLKDIKRLTSDLSKPEQDMFHSLLPSWQGSLDELVGNIRGSSVTTAPQIANKAPLVQPIEKTIATAVANSMYKTKKVKGKL